jgi:hypothetical protein
MTEQDSVTQVRESQEATRGKGKGKAVFKRGRTDAPPREPEENAKGRPSTGQEQNAEPEVIARIQQRAYWLYEAGGFEHGHDLEHWLEAKRQITGSSERASGD